MPYRLLPGILGEIFVKMSRFSFGSVLLSVMCVLLLPYHANAAYDCSGHERFPSVLKSDAAFIATVMDSRISGDVLQTLTKISYSIKGYEFGNTIMSISSAGPYLERGKMYLLYGRRMQDNTIYIGPCNSMPVNAGVSVLLFTLAVFSCVFLIWSLSFTISLIGNGYISPEKGTMGILFICFGIIYMTVFTAVPLMMGLHAAVMF